MIQADIDFYFEYLISFILFDMKIGMIVVRCLCISYYLIINVDFNQYHVTRH